MASWIYLIVIDHSGLINFAKFREDSLEYYSVHTERVVRFKYDINVTKTNLRTIFVQGTLKEHKEKLIATEAGIHEEIAQLK